MENIIIPTVIPEQTAGLAAAPAAAEKNEERAHHLYSPSTLQNREACPCYEGRSGTHIAAIRGTMQHAVVETGEDDHKLDDDEALNAAECLDYYQRQKQLLEEARLRKASEWPRSLMAFEKGVPIPAKVLAGCLAEQEVELPPVIDLVEAYLPVDDCRFSDEIVDSKTGEKSTVETISTTAGYVDRALISWDRKYAVLLDWKFGVWEVESAENNLQGIAYVLGLFRKYKTLEAIKFVFKQPQLNLLTDFTFHRAQVPELYLRVQTVVARAREARRMTNNEDFSMAIAKVPACNFCGNIGRCTKVVEMACKVGSKFHPLEIPADITPTGVKNPKDTTLGLRLAAVMQVWADAFKRTTNDRVIRRDAEIPPGYKLQTRQDREIVDPAKFKEVSLKYLTAKELESLASYTFGPIEEVISDNAPRGSKTSTLKEYAQALLDSGAVKLGNAYTFLRVASSKDKTENGAK